MIECGVLDPEKRHRADQVLQHRAVEQPDRIL